MEGTVTIMDASQRAMLELPAGFTWVYWDPAIRCVDCGLTFSALAPTLELEQSMYDEMAAEHRRRCPGDGA